MLRFFYNGIKGEDGKLQKCSYSIGNLIGDYPENTISIYAKDYSRFTGEIRSEMLVHNESDTMTDYFENDRIRLVPGHKHYKAALKALIDGLEKDKKRKQKKVDEGKRYHTQEDVDRIQMNIVELMTIWTADVEEISEDEIIIDEAAIEEELNAILPDAIAAHNATSFSPEKRGKSLIDSAKVELIQDLKDLKKSGSLGNYKDKYISHLRNYIAKKSRCMSSMITGPANFPVDRNRRAMNAERKAWEDFDNWRKRYFKAVNRISTLSPEDDMDKAAKELDKLIANQEVMKSVNKIVRSSSLSRDEKIQQVKDLEFFSNSSAIDLVDKPDCHGTYGFPSYALTNNNAKIKSRREKIMIMKNRIKTRDEFQDIEFDGGCISIENDRVIIKHDEKPDREVIDKIKARGFRWSRKFSCWSRKHTAQAIYDAKLIVGV